MWYFFKISLILFASTSISIDLMAAGRGFINYCHFCFCFYCDQANNYYYPLKVMDVPFFFGLQYKGKLDLEPGYDNFSCCFLRIHHNRWFLQWECGQLGEARRASS